jgi:uncharacterized protein YndB with AHSA1/START domain
MDALKSLLLLLTVVAVATVAILLMASGGDAAFTLEGLTRIDHPRDDVYEELSEPAERLKWMQGLTECRSDTARIAVGTTLKETIQDAQGRHQRTVEVLEAEPGEVFAVRILEPGRQLEVRYHLAPHQSTHRTRVDFKVSGHFDAWWARVLEPFMSSDVGKEIEADLARLGEHLRSAA